MHDLIEKNRKNILDIAGSYGIESVSVFGSMARGDADDSSDVDLLVSLPEGVSGLALGGLLMDVRDLLGRRVDVLTENVIDPALRERVIKEAVQL